MDKEDIVFSETDHMQMTFGETAPVVFEDIHVTRQSNVVQSNYLIEHKPKMTEDEHKMFLTLVASINKDDEDFKNIKLKVTDIIDLWEIPQKNAYRKVKKALSGLLDKKFELERIRKDGTKYVEKTTYISSFSYGEGEGYAMVRIDPMFKPYLLGLKNDPYTLFVLENVVHLKGGPAIRTFELLAQYAGLGHRAFTVKDYKKKIGVEDKYKGSNANLKKNVLDKVVKQISENTMLLTRYDLTGRGENAVITFTIFRKEQLNGKKPSMKNFGKEEKEILMMLLKDETDIDVRFPDEQIKQAIDIATEGAITKSDVIGRYGLLKEAFEAYEARAAEDGIKYPWPYFRKIIVSKVQDVK